MVRLVKIISVLILLGFMLWAILPGYNTIVGVMNNTTNMTSLESAEWKLLPIVIPAMIVIAVIWYYFSHREEEQ